MNPHLVRAPRREVTRLAVRPDFAALLAELREEAGLVALDSAGGEPARWSWIAFAPLERVGAPPGDPALLNGWVEQAALAPADVPGPFAGGFLGALGYELGVHGERQDLPADPWGSPSLVGGVYDSFFVFDHEQGEVHLVLGAGAGPERRAALLEAAARASSGRVPARTFEGRGALERRVLPGTHRARIEAAREEIAAGEIYQANLAHPFELRTAGDPLDAYLALRRINAAPYMFFQRFDRASRWSGGPRADGALLSASPELLLEVRGERARTRPIKGTAPRASDAAMDAQLARELLESSKDRAELAMIVDLVRNDLGRVAAPGSVRALGFPTLRSYPGVHHLMADVECRLARGRSTLDALLALFPGGSITGAPKLRSMEVIAELEGEGRGFFTGSAGFLDLRGEATFNILIRTLEWRADREQGAGRLRFHVGGGITWGSDPAAEERETLVKGARLARALGFEWELDG